MDGLRRNKRPLSPKKEMKRKNCNSPIKLDLDSQRVAVPEVEIIESHKFIEIQKDSFCCAISAIENTIATIHKHRKKRARIFLSKLPFLSILNFIETCKA